MGSETWSVDNSVNYNWASIFVPIAFKSRVNNSSLTTQQAKLAICHLQSRLTITTPFHKVPTLQRGNISSSCNYGPYFGWTNVEGVMVRKKM